MYSKNNHKKMRALFRMINFSPQTKNKLLHHILPAEKGERKNFTDLECFFLLLNTSTPTTKYLYIYIRP